MLFIFLSFVMINIEINYIKKHIVFMRFSYFFPLFAPKKHGRLTGCYFVQIGLGIQKKRIGGVFFRLIGQKCF